jgi:hypothetical protein
MRAGPGATVPVANIAGDPALAVAVGAVVGVSVLAR